MDAGASAATGLSGAPGAAGEVADLAFHDGPAARGPLVMSSKMTSNGRDQYRIAIGLLPSPVSCGNTNQSDGCAFCRNSASTVS